MTSKLFCFGAAVAVCAFAAVSSAYADDAACSVIRAAGGKTRSLNFKATGYAFANDTPDIYGPGTEVCTRVRDEAAGGQPATLYTQTFTAPAGSTSAQIWISKSTGQILREEIDGDVKGKGKGHMSATSK